MRTHDDLNLNSSPRFFEVFLTKPYSIFYDGEALRGSSELNEIDSVWK